MAFLWASLEAAALSATANWPSRVFSLTCRAFILRERGREGGREGAREGGQRGREEGEREGGREGEREIHCYSHVTIPNSFYLFFGARWLIHVHVAMTSLCLFFPCSVSTCSAVCDC